VLRLIQTLTMGCVVLLAACTRDRTVTRDLKEAAQLHAVLAREIATGSDVRAGVAFLERNQFRCLDQISAPWGERQGLSYMYCDKEVGAGWPMLRRWQVALVHGGRGQVQEILVSTGLVGP
jgi:hypothetical protein